MAHSQYIDYYVKQAQTGKGMNYFAGLPSQKGYGIGSFLGGLFRTIFPFLREGAQTVGREALRAGSHILADVASGSQPINASVKRHAAEAGQNLMAQISDKMKGNGIKPRSRLKTVQSKFRVRGGKVTKKKSNRFMSDIFG